MNKTGVRRVILSFIFVWGLWAGSVWAAVSGVADIPVLELSPEDRILVLAPHPDDEVIGCGGVLEKAVQKGLPIRIVFLTNGDNNQWSFLVYRKHPVVQPGAVRAMGAVRRAEAVAASEKLGIPKESLTFLGYPDFGTLDIWRSRWGRRPPLKSMLTQVRSVPYLDALRPGANYKGEDIVRDLKTVIRDFKPTKVFVSHSIDHNPDHRALYLFARVALWDLHGQDGPEIFPYLVHFRKWPMPHRFDIRQALEPPDELKEAVHWYRVDLSPEEALEKFDALRLHKSQYSSSMRYLRLFVRANELFGDYPLADLRQGPDRVMLGEGKDIPPEEWDAQLLESERASFVGVRSTTVAMAEGDLIFTVELSRPLGKTVGLSIYAFGYRHDRAFEKMPKINVSFGAIWHRVFDQNRRLKARDVKIIRKARKIIVRIPLSLLGGPDRVLTSARTYIGRVPLDWVPWRVLELK